MVESLKTFRFVAPKKKVVKTRRAEPTPLADQISALRDLTMDSWFRDGFMAARAEVDFHQFFNTLDVVDDTESACLAYLKWFRGRDTLGRAYLYTFGALQSLAVQQDAVAHLFSSIGVPLRLSKTDASTLALIRDTRVAVAGHPTKRARGVPATEFTSIIQATLTRDSFEALSYTIAGLVTREVELPNLVRRQSLVIEKALRRARRAIQKLIDDHRRKYRTSPLAPPFEAFLAELRSADPATHPKVMRRAAGQVIAELSKRGLGKTSEAQEQMKFHLDKTSNRLSAGLTPPFLREAQTVLDMLKEIDESYLEPASTMVSRRRR